MGAKEEREGNTMILSHCTTPLHPCRGSSSVPCVFAFVRTHLEIEVVPDTLIRGMHHSEWLLQMVEEAEKLSRGNDVRK